MSDVGFVVMMIFFSVLGVLCVAGGLWAKNSLNNGEGCYFIGGPNGDAWKFFRKHPSASKIFKYVDAHGLSVWTDSAIESLFSLGAKAILRAKAGSDLIVITDEMALIYGKPSPNGDPSGGTKGHIYTKASTFRGCLRIRDIPVPVGSYTTPKKQKSVVGNAVAGAVVAGGVGAVVGAVSALNNNVQNKDAVDTHFIMGKSGVSVLDFSFHMCTRSFLLDTIDISPSLKKEFPLPQTPSTRDIYDTARNICARYLENTHI